MRIKDASGVRHGHPAIIRAIMHRVLESRPEDGIQHTLSQKLRGRTEMKNAIANAPSNHNSSTNALTITDAPKPSTTLRKRRNVLSMILGLAALACITIAASAQVTWEPPAKQYGTGFAPRIAADGGTVVEVHQLDSGSGPLEYRT